MPGIDNIPPDHRAVLSLVVRRQKSYAEIADALQIDEQAVYERAHAALAELAGKRADDLSASEREQVGDYLLGQQSPSERLITYDQLEGSPAARSFAQAVAAELGSIPSAALPEIPQSRESSGGRQARVREEPDSAEKAAGPTSPVASRASGAMRGRDRARRDRPRRGRSRPPAAPAESVEPAPASRRQADDSPIPAAPPPRGRAAHGPEATTRERSRREGGVAGVRALPSSRVGGAILLAAIAVGAVLAVVLTSSGGGSGTAKNASAAAQRTANGSGAGATGTSGQVHLQKQLKLTSPGGGGGAVGEAAVLSDSGRYVIALAAERLAPSQGFFYAAWLYNSPSQAYALGKAPAVSSNGQLKPVAQALPESAGAYHQVIITKETSEHPAAPGEIVLSGPFSLH